MDERHEMMEAVLHVTHGVLEMVMRNHLAMVHAMSEKEIDNNMQLMRQDVMVNVTKEIAKTLNERGPSGSSTK